MTGGRQDALRPGPELPLCNSALQNLRSCALGSTVFLCESNFKYQLLVGEGKPSVKWYPNGQSVPHYARTDDTVPISV